MSNMNSVPVPEGYLPLIPYLILKDAAGFVEFAKTVFGATEKMMHANDDGSLMHGELHISGGMVMVGEASDNWPQNTAGIYLYVQDADATYAAGLAHGATSLMEPADKEYGRSCGFRDPYGNTWWPTSVGKS